MPVYTAAHNAKIEAVVFSKVESKDAIVFADTLAKSNQAQRQWNPLTLLGAGMFHLAFGALLTGGAVTRGFAKKSEIEGYYRYGQQTNYEDSDDNRPGSYNGGYRPDYTPARQPMRPRSTATDGPMKKTDG